MGSFTQVIWHLDLWVDAVIWLQKSIDSRSARGRLTDTYLLHSYWRFYRPWWNIWEIDTALKYLSTNWTGREIAPWWSPDWHHHALVLTAATIGALILHFRCTQIGSLNVGESKLGSSVLNICTDAQGTRNASMMRGDEQHLWGRLVAS